MSIPYMHIIIFIIMNTFAIVILQSSEFPLGNDSIIARLHISVKVFSRIFQNLCSISRLAEKSPKFLCSYNEMKISPAS